MVNPFNLPKIDIKDIQSCPGIYFFFDKEDLVYIGMSFNIERRMKNHNKIHDRFTIACLYVEDAPINFKRKSIGVCAVNNTTPLYPYLFHLENKYILKYKPILNYWRPIANRS